MANNDKIHEAYIGLRGKEQQEKTQERINWILNEVGDHKKILDIGCSQGIISLLMGQKGKEVQGLDIQEEAIEYANHLLEKDYKECKGKVHFKCTDFIAFEEEEQYDCIVITEVLEHLENPKQFLNHAQHYLKHQGKLVMTVPFGVSDHPDHKATFYLSQLVELVEQVFQIEKIEYIGRWTGITAKCRKSTKKFEYNYEQTKRLEEHFCKLDWEMTKRIQELYSNNIEMSKKYKQSLDQYAKIKNDYKEVLDKRKQVNENYESLKNNYTELLKKYNDSNTEKQLLTSHKDELASTVQELYREVNDVIEILKANKATINKLKTQNNYLRHENEEYKRKLSLITDTFIGKIAIKGYKLLKKIKRKFK